MALGASGRLFVGVNLEFLGLPLHHSVHAEQFLIANAAQAGEAALTRMAISAVPCGHCRQFCSELACAVRGHTPPFRCLGQGTYAPPPRPPAAQDALEFLLGEGRTYALAELLPIRFRPSDLLDESVTPLLLQRQRHDLRLLPGALADAGHALWLVGGSAAQLPQGVRGCCQRRRLPWRCALETRRCGVRRVPRWRPRAAAMRPTRTALAARQSSQAAGPCSGCEPRRCTSVVAADV